MGSIQVRRFGVPVLDRFLAECQIRRVAPKTLIISGGETSSSLYFILDGSVAVISEDEDGHEVVVAYLNRGEFFGEMGLFQDAATRSAWVRAREACVLGEISYARFRELARRDPDLLFALSGQLATRLKVTTRKVRDLVFLDVAGRIARTLLDLCEQPDAMTHPDGMQIRVSRQELGRIVGCSREMAGRVLKLLEEQSLISAAGKTIVVFGVCPGNTKPAPLASRLHHRK